MADIQNEHIPTKPNHCITNACDPAGTSTLTDMDERIVVATGPTLADCSYSPLADDVESRKRSIPNTFQYPDEEYAQPGGYH
jgi:hypothetical protein